MRQQPRHKNARLLAARRDRERSADDRKHGPDANGDAV